MSIVLVLLRIVLVVEDTRVIILKSYVLMKIMFLILNIVKVMFYMEIFSKA